MRYLHELPADLGIQETVSLNGCPVHLSGKNRVNILALGDVGTTMLIGLRLLGSDVISEIGIMDIRKENLERLEMEINQIGYPFGSQELPPVHIIDADSLFDCDLLIFCASKGVPPVKQDKGVPPVRQDKGVPPVKEDKGVPSVKQDKGVPPVKQDKGVPPVKQDGTEQKIDVRMVQLEANRDIIRQYADMARKAEYQGMIAVVSDPVDNLAAAFLDAAGLKPWQIQGYGLGVMNMRALYYSRKETEGPAGLYETEGRAFGPHGQDLVIANSIEHYDEEASARLTELTVSANLKVRDLGFKPYIAPALSSAAISILLTLRGEWHYGSVYFGSEETGAFVGVRNRLTENGFEYEDIPLPEQLYERIHRAYTNLCKIR